MLFISILPCDVLKDDLAPRADFILIAMFFLVMKEKAKITISL